MKLRIVNLNYINNWERGGLKRARRLREKPWCVDGAEFPTHAEAIRYADEMVRALREVP